VGMKTKTIATTLVKGAFAMKAIPIFIGVGVVVGDIIHIYILVRMVKIKRLYYQKER
jgi:hypothetical protein